MRVKELMAAAKARGTPLTLAEASSKAAAAKPKKAQGKARKSQGKAQAAHDEDSE